MVDGGSVFDHMGGFSTGDNVMLTSPPELAHCAPPRCLPLLVPLGEDFSRVKSAINSALDKITQVLNGLCNLTHLLHCHYPELNYLYHLVCPLHCTLTVTQYTLRCRDPACRSANPQIPRILCILRICSCICCILVYSCILLYSAYFIP